MPKASKKKRIKVLRGVLRQVRVELYKIYTPDGQRNLDGAPIDLVAHLVAKKFTNLTKRMDDLEEAFSTMEDAEPIRQLLLKELGDGSGSESREGMNTLELVELLAKRYRRSERASRDWQNHASEQAEQLTKIKTELLSVCSRPDERLTPLEVADTVAESVRLLREMLEEARKVVEPSELAAARNTIKDLNRITELHVSDVDVLDEAHRLVGAAGDENLSNQDLIVGLIAIVRSLKEEPSRDQSVEPAVRPVDPDPADPDPTAVPG